MSTEINNYLKLDFSNWKCRASGTFNLMGGALRLTDAQTEALQGLDDKLLSGKPLTDLQNIKYIELTHRKDNPQLPEGAKTYIEGEVDKALYDFTVEVYAKEMEKGTLGEPESIEVHNAVHFTSYKKADLPNSNEYLTTESCDIDDPKNDTILDVKTPWSKKSFPKTLAKAYATAKKAGYPYQMQSYMSIYKRLKALLSFNLIDTPEDLCAYEDQSMHVMGDLDLALRNTTISYEHSDALEIDIYERVVLSRSHMQAYYEEILRDHGLVKIVA